MRVSLTFFFLTHLASGGLVFLSIVGAAVIQQGPSNMAVVVGSRMTMTCQVDPSAVRSVDWYFTGFGRHDRRLINRGGAVSKANFDEFAVDGAVPGQRLTTESVRLQHAGLYTCSVTDRSSESNVVASAQLTVLASNPVCAAETTIVRENDTIEMSCVVNYSGSWEPVIEWKQHVTPNDVTGSVVTDGRSDTIVRGNAVTGRVLIRANINRPNSRYSSRTFFRSFVHRLNATATNVPDYAYSWTSPVVQVTFGPNDLVVRPRDTRTTFNPGNQLNCSASANPAAVIRWKNLETGEVVHGPEFVVTDSMARSEPHRLVCIARNSVTGTEVSSEAINMTVQFSRQICGTSLLQNHASSSSSSSGQNFLVVIIIVAGTAVIIIASLVVYAVYLKRKLRDRDRTERRKVGLPVAVNRARESNYGGVYVEIPGYSAFADQTINRESEDSGVGSYTASCGGQYLPPTKADSTLRRDRGSVQPSSVSSSYDVLSGHPTDSTVTATPTPAVQNNECLIPDRRRLLATSAADYSLARFRAADQETGEQGEQGEQGADYLGLTGRNPRLPRPMTTTYTPLNEIYGNDKQQIGNDDYLEPVPQPIEEDNYV